MSEARGLLADMLAWKDLPPNVVSGLRAINSLLNPHHTTVSLDLGNFAPTIAENPMTGENFLTNLVRPDSFTSHICGQMEEGGRM